jgi:hypothetical protein
MNVLKGFYDLHLHSAPAPFARIGDSEDIAQWCAAAGMAGIVIKSHFESTVSKAYHARKAVAQEYPDFQVFSAIALNRGVGGLNRGAVELALEQGAKVVWLPTLDAKNHGVAFGASGTYGFREMTLQGKGEPVSYAYTIVNEAGQLLPEVKDIVKMTMDYDVVLGTGHLSKAEIFTLVDYTTGLGHRKVVCTHPEMKTPGMTAAEMRQLTEAKVTLEFCAVYLAPVFACITLDDLAQHFKTLDSNYILLSSDGGQPFNLKPHLMLEVVVRGLMVKGVPQEILDRVCVANPRRLMTQAAA